MLSIEKLYSYKKMPAISAVQKVVEEDEEEQLSTEQLQLFRQE